MGDPENGYGFRMTDYIFFSGKSTVIWKREGTVASQVERAREKRK
jgi:hypothetical protein